MKLKMITSSFIAAATVIGLGTSTAFASTTSNSYVVQSGDSLWKIATSHSVSVSNLIAWNDLNSTTIYPGEALQIPNKTSYIVQSNDTMYAISVKLGISLNSLINANPQISNPSDIWTGLVLNLPQISVTTTAPSSSAPTNSTTSSNTTASEIIAYGESFIGKVPYVYGGTSPVTGWDCSGFVQYVYGHSGINLPRESDYQAQIGTSVSINNLQPGDLLFYDNTDSAASTHWDGITHVSIWLGNDSMLEASSVKSSVVIVHNVLENLYYNAHFWGAKRVIN